MNGPGRWHLRHGAAAHGRIQARPLSPARRRPAYVTALIYASAAPLGLLAAVLILRLGPPFARNVHQALERRLASPSTASRTLEGQLLYTVTRDDASAVYHLKPGGASHPTTDDHDAGDAIAALASADGRLLLTLHDGCPRCAALYKLRDLTTNSVWPIGSAPMAGADVPARPDASFAGDGRRVAFTEAGIDAPLPRIFLFDMKASIRRPLSPNDPEAQSNPVWSPDGGTVAYLSGATKTVVTVVDADTGALRALNDQLDHASSLAWSPDGRYVSLLRKGQLWLVETANGHGFAPPVPGVVAEIGGWAPGSRALVVLAEDRSPLAAFRYGVLVVAADGGPDITIQVGDGLLSPRWSADGRSIAWVDGKAGVWSIDAAPATGGPVRHLATGSGSATLNAWP